MGNSSITSSFKFESYKIDSINYVMTPDIGLLAFKGIFNEDLWNFSISIKHPLYLKKDKKYIGGLKCNLSLMDPKKPKDDKANDTQEGSLLNIDIGITGLFSVESGRFEKDVELNLVKLQIPAILLPYVRVAITSILANAGFGSVMLPLINLHQLPDETKKEIKIQEVE